MPVLSVIDDTLPHRQMTGPLTTETIPGPPQLLVVSDTQGELATLTVGAKTVTVRGATRTFTEDKRPFTDEFERVSDSGFTVSPGGGNWSQSGDIAQYTVSDGIGHISCATANASRHTTVVDNLTDVDVTAKVTIATAPAGAASSIGLSFGYTDVNNHNRARLVVTTAGVIQLALEKEVAGTTTTLAPATQVGTGFTDGQWWHIRAQRAGSTVRCRAWLDGTPEPSAWLHTVTDTDNPVGRVGFRALASTGSTGLPRVFQVDDLEVISGTWSVIPVITHDTWVRLLPTPFDGNWNESLADQVRQWATDTTPDALAYAMMYITGAPVVLMPELGNAQVAGQSKYGPLDPVTGVPIEGADFHDYMNRDWTFPNGETWPAEPDEQGCMDCSGYVRMVYGFQMGLPMVRLTDFDGINLPRITRDIGLSGPGIIVAQAQDTAPPLTDLRIGDVPHFDADTSDPVPGQFDHNGIYLGVDTLGHPRFVNSRKTPHGPTFGDLGGASRLDGSGTYATTLRLIRRF